MITKNKHKMLKTLNKIKWQKQQRQQLFHSNYVNYGIRVTQLCLVYVCISFTIHSECASDRDGYLGFISRNFIYYQGPIGGNGPLDGVKLCCLLL